MNNHYSAVGLLNPKSPSNVGSVMRAAGCFGADAVFYTGSRYDRAASFYTDTHGAATRIPLQRVESLASLASADTQLVCVELVEGAVSLPLYRHPPRAVYVFGPEDGSIAQSIVDRADDVVYMPTHMCLNLAASVNVLLYDRLSKTEARHGGDALVRASRDTNNQLVFNKAAR